MEVVGQTGDGREAVDLASLLEPDVIVMDVTLPGITGDEATRQIKLHQPRRGSSPCRCVKKPRCRRRCVKPVPRSTWPRRRRRRNYWLPSAAAIRPVANVPLTGLSRTGF